MNKEDLENFTKDEVVDILVDLVNGMDSKGNYWLKKFDDGGREVFEHYAYGTALVTKVNYAKIRVAHENEKNIVPNTDGIETIRSFMEWKEKQKKVLRGDTIMYDVKRHYKYLLETELFDHWLSIKDIGY